MSPANIPSASGDATSPETVSAHLYAFRCSSITKSGRWYAAHLSRAIKRIRHAVVDSSIGLDAENALRWIYDNEHVVQVSLQQVRRQLSSRFARQLPLTRVSRDEFKEAFDLPRVHLLAASIEDAAQGPLDIRFIEEMVEEFQRNETLKLSELWALPTFLRIATLDQLCIWAEKLLDDYDSADSSLLIVDDFLGASIMSLRALENADWQKFVENSSVVEKTLLADPASVYGQMDRETRNDYRSSVEKVARASQRSEQEVAQTAIDLAGLADKADPCRSHVGYYLLEDGRRQLYRELKYDAPLRDRLTELSGSHLAFPYLALIFAPPLLLAAFALSYLLSMNTPSVLSAIVCIGLFLVVLDPAAQVVNRLMAALRTPRTLPKMDFSSSVPGYAQTLLVVPCLLTRRKTVSELLDNLELNFISARTSVAHFALLTDFVDAPKPTMPGDKSLLRMAEQGIAVLNERYGSDSLPSPFALLHRRRLWNDNEKVWMGWERKRGKIEELNSWLQGAGDTSVALITGDRQSLLKSRYVITLDADTRLVPDSATRLIGAMSHPLNRPVRVDGELVRGYSLIQPRVQTLPESANATRFSQLYSGDSGIDLYSNAVSDLYQDLFGEGIYAGKGIYDVESFAESLKGEIPSNLVLSHDLLEGLFARAAMATDISVMESCPENMRSYVGRSHRWTRGDWQLLRWAFGRARASAGIRLRFRPGVIGRWKLIDNLRRSLVAPLKFALLVTAPALLPGELWLWTLLILCGGPVSMALAAGDQVRFGNWRPGGIGDTLGRVAGAAITELFRWLHSLVFLPAEALSALDAIVRSLYRQFISRRGLLEWTTAADEARQLSARGLRSLTRSPWTPAFIALGVGAGLYAFSLLLWPTVALLLLWLSAPIVNLYTGRPMITSASELSEHDESRLRQTARETWRYFEELVGPQSGWLPPDNVQFHKQRMVAYRTSPTNIGLYFLSVMTAVRLGYLGTQELLVRLSNSLTTLEKLKTHRGHFLNWYDIENLQTLQPEYVSTVDSGNFVASLIATREGLESMCCAARTDDQFRNGLVDTLHSLERHWRRLRGRVDSDPVTESIHDALGLLADELRSMQWRQTLTRLRSVALPAVEAAVLEAVSDSGSSFASPDIDNIRGWLQQLGAQIRFAAREYQLLAHWREELLSDEIDSGEIVNSLSLTRLRRLAGHRTSLDKMPRILRIAHVLLGRISGSQTHEPKTRAWLERCQKSVRACREESIAMLDRIQALSRRLQRLIDATEFGFLFDPERKIFHIGFNVDRAELDNSYYDLLASEARIASVVAIAKGDVPVSHWLHLGRPITKVGSTRVLLSWSGTLFEYLMPALFMRGTANGLLTQSAVQAIRLQQRFARRRGLPWGISESAYQQTDSEGTYQYRAFGLSDLALARYEDSRVVVSPYASILALPFVSGDITENLEHIDRLKGSGRYGYYDALDFGMQRTPQVKTAQLVHSFMAHHQGMILVAISNALFDNAVVRDFRADPRVSSIEYLFAEKTPGARAIDKEMHRTEAPLPQPSGESFSLTPWDVEPREHQLTVLSNGRMQSVLTSATCGALLWDGLALTRDRIGADGPTAGSQMLLRDIEQNYAWQLGVDCDAEHRHCVFAPHFAEFREDHNDLTVRMNVGVAHDADIEYRHITISNHSSRPRHIAVSYCAEVCLTEARGFERHPSFQKMFIRSRHSPEKYTQIFQRRAASADEHPLFLGQRVCFEPEAPIHYQAHADRARYRGRNRPLREAPGLSDSQVHTDGPKTASLDPMMGAVVTLRIEPQQTQQCAFITGAASSEGALVDQLSNYRTIERVRWVQAQAEVHMAHALNDLGSDEREYRSAMALLSACTWPSFFHSGKAPVTTKNLKEIQSTLWRLGISGDLPIIGTQLKRDSDLAGVEVLLRQLNCIRQGGVSVDLVLIDESQSGYAQPVRQKLERLIDTARAAGNFQIPGGIYVLSAWDLSVSELANVQHACVVLRRARDWLTRTEVLVRRGRNELPFVPIPSSQWDVVSTRPVTPSKTLKFAGQHGGFSADGKEYEIFLEAGEATPRPWCNVMSNPEFGSVVTETGSSFTWWRNSNEYRLTPWYNDAVFDRSGEAVYLRDEESGAVWSPTPAPCAASMPYKIRHGAGYTSFEHNSNGLSQHMTVFVDPDEPVKIVRLKLSNQWERQRRITATLATEWVLGNAREHGGHYLIAEVLEDSRGFSIRNVFGRGEQQRHAFVASSKVMHSYSTSRDEFIGPANDWSAPRGLHVVGLTDDDDACEGGFTAAMMHMDIAPNADVCCHFIIGAAADLDTVESLIDRFTNVSFVKRRFDQLNQTWDAILGQCQITTARPEIDVLFNRWVLYQSLSSRIWGRAGFYQTGGGYGFRDQLQDAMALLNVKPALVRDHILLAAGRQFCEGDVLHWWHEYPLRGVRTRCSDDLLWLPYVVVRYLTVTGDSSLLRESVAFLEGPGLESEELERYAEFSQSPFSASIYDHCCRAIDARLELGVHGLPYIGTGDWNDGLSRVGAAGRGESVWMAWFLMKVCRDFAPFCESQGDVDRSTLYLQHAATLEKNVDKSAWDGDWYLRGFYDDGTALGSVESQECKIDLNAQTWSIIAKDRVSRRSEIAMNSACHWLEDDEHRLVKLLAPPFEHTARDPGYIRAYPPGVRENGGQYSHAAVWAAWAAATAGNTDLALKWAEWISPLSRTLDEPAESYGCEPYAFVADVYSGENYNGRGGWSWYTGTAAWWYRLVLEQLLGITRRGARLYVEPRLPPGWPAYRVVYKTECCTYTIVVESPGEITRQNISIAINGKSDERGYIDLAATEDVDVLIRPAAKQ